MSNLLEDLAEQPVSGVSWDKKGRKWRAGIRAAGRHVHLGFFYGVSEANSARRAAELRFDGYHHASRAVVVRGEVIHVPLVGRRGGLQGHALVDIADLHLVDGRFWHLSAGYPSVKIDGEDTRLHRLILPDAVEVDHRDGDKLNCRRANLRACSHAENCRNMPARRANRLGLKGVRQTPEGRFSARIKVAGRAIYLGRFDDAADAARAYDRAALLHHGDFARLNFARGDQ